MVKSKINPEAQQKITDYINNVDGEFYTLEYWMGHIHEIETIKGN